ncbi:MAG: ABC transporter ATP-binding protein [Gammaproteobacteria bacterium]|nr:ABC transporter ATP-binding protein [Gammaproteobacteria bacterium]
MHQQSSFRAVRDLYKYAEKYRQRIVAASVCSIVNKFLDILPEVLIGIAIDVVIRQQHSFIASLGITDPYQQLLLLGGITFLVWAGESLFEYLYLVLWRNLAQDLQHDARIDAYARVQHFDLGYFDKNNTGNLIAIMNDDVNQLERFLNGGANSIIQVFTTVIVIGAIFFFLSPLIALIAFTPIPVIIIGAFYFQRRAQPLYRQVREKVGLLSSRLAANLGGIKTIKSFTTEDFELENVSRDSRDYVAANREAIRISSAFIPIIRMAILAGFMATLLVGGWLTLNGRLQVGSYGALVYLTQRLLWPLTDLAQVVDLFERAMASTHRILELLATPILIRDRKDAITKSKIYGELIFENVSFSYATGGPVIEGLTIEIPAGSTVAFVGPTGSGKSTLIKLIMRFYAPSEGRILLDNTDIRDLTIQSLRHHIGLVAQDTYLFPGSIIENIAYGSDNVDLQAVTAAADAAGALEFIQRMPEGMNTVVGERGQRLSGGQRQRLSIARAIFRNPSILILDEATSSVDNETEVLIQKSLDAISAGRTTLIVAHRLSTIVNADIVYVMEHGKITAAGSHSELLNQDGLYRNLWRVQTGGSDHTTA